MFENKTVFLLMRNWFDSDLRPMIRFDFKGSTVGRKSLKNDDDVFEQTLKELDYLHLQSKGQLNFIILKPELKHQFLQQIISDVSVLGNNSFIDYRYF
jgi:hypothetical protein